MTGKRRVLPFLAAIGCVLTVGACAAQASATTAATTVPVASTGVAASSSPSTKAPPLPTKSPAGPSTAPASSAPVSTAPPVATSPPGKRAPRCTSAHLAVSIVDSGAAAGTVGGFLDFTNRGSAPCTLTGWPTVSAITAAGKVTHVADATSTMIGGWTAITPMPVLTLARGQSGYAVLETSDVAINATSCPPPYTRLTARVPGGASAAGLSAYLSGLGAYLPGCLNAQGVSAVKVSGFAPSSILPQQ
jgi:hypothetical protein